MFSCAQQQQLLSQPQLLLQLLPQFQLLQPQPLPQPPQENRMMRMMMIQRPLLFPHIVPKSFLRTDECFAAYTGAGGKCMQQASLAYRTGAARRLLRLHHIMQRGVLR